MILTRSIDSYHIGYSLKLTEPQLHTLIDLFHHPKTADVSALGGRTAVTLEELTGIGSVVIKYYHRGGWIRHFMKQRYFKLGKTRARREFELLHAVGNLGINVPEPIAYAYCGRLFYRAWLVTREIHQPLSLARLSLLDEEKARAALISAIEQVSLLIQNAILHVDLHPGNVIVDSAEKVYLLDFDRGHVYHGSRRKLKDRYLTRWQRAVRKHGLPTILTEMMQKELK